MRNLVVGLMVTLILTSCAGDMPTTQTDAKENLPAELSAVVEAHGGIEKWKEMNSMEYEFTRGERNEVHKIDLRNRKVHLDGGNWKIGYDGDQVWVSPDKETYGGNSARFYHNLLFYFYAMPFVLTDPGINYEVLESKELEGKTYNRLKISYESGVGDAPDDEYILYSDPSTNKMEWLFYTVTYFTERKVKTYNALHYDGWQDVNGLLLPRTMTGYRTSADTITEKRYDNLFENVKVTEEIFDQSMFEMPAEAEIDSL